MFELHPIRIVQVSHTPTRHDPAKHQANYARMARRPLLALPFLLMAGCPAEDTTPDLTATTGASPPVSSTPVNAPPSTGPLPPARVVAPPAPTLLVNLGYTGVAAFEDPKARNGDVPPSRHYWGPHDSDSPGLSDICIDASGALIGMVPSGFHVLPPGLLTADPSDTKVEGPYHFSTGNNAMVADRASDRLYVVVSTLGDDLGHNGVLVYEDFSFINRHPEIVPARVIGSWDITSASDAALGPNGDLYIYDGIYSIVVIANVAARNGLVAADRIIELDFVQDSDHGVSNSGGYGIHVDAQDHLYLIDVLGAAHKGGIICVFDQASLQNGLVRPDRTFDFDLSPAEPVYKAFLPSDIAVDSAGVGYIMNASGFTVFNPAILIVNDIASRSGTILPDRVIQGRNTRLDDAGGLFLWE